MKTEKILHILDILDKKYILLFIPLHHNYNNKGRYITLIETGAEYNISNYYL
jgi:hypothetical protein